MALIRLQFVLGSSWSSRLIAYWGQGYRGFSHVDAVLSDGSLLGARSDAIGGAPPGVWIRPAQYEDWRRVTRVSLQVPDSAPWEAWLKSQVGCGYDKADILGLIIGRPVLEDGHWICSALQSRALKNQSILPPKMPLIDQQMTPNTLLACCYAVGFECE